ncbi:agaA [Symbiodinium necroappetens]|uniref:AgaA protein n=1 Tax=Symbiodinium necroappetens TaxID=1628268 RepID=A0A813CG65_9DINO|nr:agaA [Symbiodinium necroappetens]
MPLVWTASLAPSSGAFAIVLKSGSTCVAVNRATQGKAEMMVLPGDAKTNTVPTSARAGKGEVAIGWVNPFANEKAALRISVDGEEIVIKDVGRKAEIPLKAKKLKLSVSRVGENTVVALDDISSGLGVLERATSEQSVGSNEESVVEVDLRLGQIGVSLVDDMPTAHELLFLHIGDIHVNYVQNADADSEQLRFLVGEVQGICQLPDRTDGSMLSKKHQHKAGVLRQEQPAVILANHGEKGAHFLDIQITREATSSQDLVLPKAEVLMDKLDVTVDNDWLAPLLSWLQRAIPQEAIDVGLQWDEVKDRAGRAIVAEGYTPPAVPAIVSVEKLKLSEINLTVWCRLPVSSLDFLPAPVRAVLRVVSVGSNFTLNGAGIRLPEKKLPSHRGSVEDYAISIGLEYVLQASEFMDDKNGGDSGYGAWGKVPVWDGSPLTWRAFKREMQWWLSSLDAEATKKYNLAARWLLRQSGTVRQRGEEFSPEDLQYKKAESYTDPDSGQLVEITPEDPFFGINRLMDALEKMNGQSTLDKRGELRAQFYIHMCRKPGERVADYASRFRTSISDLRSEGVKLPDAELGWFYKEKLGLDALRKQLLETALGGTEDYSTIAAGPPLEQAHHPEDVCRSLFVFIGAAVTFYEQRRAHYKAQAHVSEAVVEEEPEEVSELFVDEPAGDAVDEADGRTLEEVLQTEVEQLAEEIEQAEAEGVDPSHLEALENGIEASAEALVSMREARVKLAEVRKDRGFKGPGFGSGSSAKGRGRGSASIQAKKKDGKHVCFDCGLPGHWAGDEGCTKPGQGLGRAKARPAKSVKIAEVVAENEVIQTEAGDGELREVMMINAEPGRNLQQAFEMSVARAEANVAASSAANVADKAVVGALDSACNRTCAGDAWIQEYIALLADAPAQVRELIQTAPETERFKFGNGGILPSFVRYRLPIVVAGEMLLVWVSAVPVGSLGLLLGRDFLDAVGGVLDFAERSLVCRVFNSKKASVAKLGPDNVIEMLLDCKAWARQLMQAPSSAAVFPPNEPHSHDMTEASLELGRRVFEYNSVLLTSARKMCCEAMAAFGVALRPSSAPGFGVPGGAGDGPWHVGVLPRWRRMVLRSLARWTWAKEGLHLALVKRPDSRLALLAVSLAFGYFGGFLESSSPDFERAWGVPEALAHPRVMDGFGAEFYDLVPEPVRPPLRLPRGPVLARDDGRGFD